MLALPESLVVSNGEGSAAFQARSDAQPTDFPPGSPPGPPRPAGAEALAGSADSPPARP